MEMKLKGGCSETFINLKFLGLFKNKIKPKFYLNGKKKKQNNKKYKQYKTNKQVPRSATFWLVL